MNISEYISLLNELFNTGGMVMPPLFICALLLWYGLGYRFWLLKETGVRSIRDTLQTYQENDNKSAENIVEHAVQQGIQLQRTGVKNLHRHLDAIFYDYKKEIGRFTVLIRVIIIISPLLGLLGTVVGMIETFDSLATMTLFAQSGGIAGGISQALISTQMGLAVAIPGLLIHSILNKKQQKIEHNFSQLKDLLCSQVNPPIKNTSL